VADTAEVAPEGNGCKDHRFIDPEIVEASVAGHMQGMTGSTRVDGARKRYWCVDVYFVGVVEFLNLKAMNVWTRARVCTCQALCKIPRIYVSDSQ